MIAAVADHNVDAMADAIRVRVDPSVMRERVAAIDLRDRVVRIPDRAGQMRVGPSVPMIDVRRARRRRHCHKWTCASFRMRWRLKM